MSNRPLDQFCRVAGVELEHGPHLDEGLVVGHLVPVEKVDEDLEDVQEGAKVGGGLLSLKTKAKIGFYCLRKSFYQSIFFSLWQSFIIKVTKADDFKLTARCHF